MMDARETDSDDRTELNLSTADLASSSRSTGTATEEVVDVRDDVRDEEGEGVAEEKDASTPLLAREETDSFTQRWEEIQARFVDEPRGAVEAADHLVAELMQRLADGFAQERSGLERHWDQGEDISTEDLRVALQRYRSFFQRLLAA